ncbi:MAG: PEPxxWA-CTERM sorting domain-containing protein [Pseudomonadota bacterium]
MRVSFAPALAFAFVSAVASTSALAGTARVQGSAYDQRYDISQQGQADGSASGVLNEGAGNPGYAQQRQTSVATANATTRSLHAAASHVIRSDDIPPYNKLNEVLASASIESNVKFVIPGQDRLTPFRVNFNPVVIDGLLGLRGPDDKSWEGFVQMSYLFQISGYYAQTTSFISSLDPADQRVRDFEGYEFDLNSSGWVLYPLETYKMSQRLDVKARLAPTFNGQFRNANAVASSNFGNTVYWGGIASLTLMDGTPIENWSLDISDGIDWTSASPRGTAAVPEPASWALAILGFAIAGSGLRRRPAPRMA